MLIISKTQKKPPGAHHRGYAPGGLHLLSYERNSLFFQQEMDDGLFEDSVAVKVGRRIHS